MKYILLLFISIISHQVSHAQFHSVSTNVAGWAVGNVNVAFDINVNLRNTINLPISANPFKFKDTQWKHIAIQPGWRHWFVERYVGQFISPSLIYVKYQVGYDKHLYTGDAYGVGVSWGYSKLLSTRWNFVIEFGIGIVYTPYREQLRAKYIEEFDTEYTYHHQRVLILPAKCNISFSYLF